MLVVDPMKRITIAEIKQHPWFMQSIPLYLTLSPEQMEEQAAKVDEEVREHWLHGLFFRQVLVFSPTGVRLECGIPQCVKHR